MIIPQPESNRGTPPERYTEKPNLKPTMRPNPQEKIRQEELKHPQQHNPREKTAKKHKKQYASGKDEKEFSVHNRTPEEFIQNTSHTLPRTDIPGMSGTERDDTKHWPGKMLLSNMLMDLY